MSAINKVTVPLLILRWVIELAPKTILGIRFFLNQMRISCILSNEQPHLFRATKILNSISYMTNEIIGDLFNEEPRLAIVPSNEDNFLMWLRKVFLEFVCKGLRVSMNVHVYSET